jgi:AcrR family transcriptional regulator
MLYNHLMPPKVQFSKEQILDTAFELVADAGMAALSVRALAKRLGSSVAPIYVNFKNTGELMAALERKIIDVVWRYSTREYCTHGFFNIGIGQLLFVRDYPRLYHDLVIRHPGDKGYGVSEQMVDIMVADSLLEGLSREQCRALLEKMAIQTSGLSLAIAREEPALSLERALGIMEETANQLIFAEKQGYGSAQIKRICIDGVD